MEKEKMKNQIKFAKLEQVALSEKDKKNSDKVPTPFQRL
jgi:hypothetical protein